ncbi:MAG: hypothetical protein ABFD90_08860 [Phycisphaerales bacterium]
MDWRLETAILNAMQYAEGRGVWVQAKRRADVDTVKKLVEIKMTN